MDNVEFRTSRDQMPRADYLNDPVFQRMQFEVRAAFEAGYRAAKPVMDRSKLNPAKGEWHDHWLASKARAFLVANGLMTGMEGFK